MSYVPGYIGQDAPLNNELWRIAQAFEEAQPIGTKRIIEVPASSSVAVASREQLGVNALYVAVVGSHGTSDNFTAYILRASGMTNTPILVAFANNGTLHQLNIDGSNNLEIVNNFAGDRMLSFNLLRLL